jgi:hypothetical protein
MIDKEYYEQKISTTITTFARETEWIDGVVGDAAAAAVVTCSGGEQGGGPTV